MAGAVRRLHRCRVGAVDLELHAAGWRLAGARPAAVDVTGWPCTEASTDVRTTVADTTGSTSSTSGPPGLGRSSPPRYSAVRKCVPAENVRVVETEL